MNGSLVEYAVWIGLILVAALMGYIAGIRRRPSRHGSVQLRAPRNRRQGQRARRRPRRLTTAPRRWSRHPAAVLGD
jgi:hypothetical protein